MVSIALEDKARKKKKCMAIKFIDSAYFVGVVTYPHTEQHSG